MSDVAEDDRTGFYTKARELLDQGFTPDDVVMKLLEDPAYRRP